MPGTARKHQLQGSLIYHIINRGNRRDDIFHYPIPQFFWEVIGIVFWDFEESSVVKNAGVTVSIDPAFAMKFGGGIDFFVTENIAIFGEGSFIWSDADASATAGGTIASATLDYMSSSFL